MRIPSLLTALVLGALGLATARAERVELSLDGDWEIEESATTDWVPGQFKHHAPVPGLVNLAEPPFADVDLFDSKELIANRIRQHRLPESARVDGAGVSRQSRSYFWYRRTFRIPARKQTATLRIGKAQFGTAVWVNGTKVGEYPGCFTASYFDVSDYLHAGADNVLVIRVGAHPGMLPANFPAGTDFEKLKWTPGIYDRVALWLSDNPTIETVQVAPRIEPREIVVQTKVKNRGTKACTTELTQLVRPWKRKQTVGAAEPVSVTLQPGEERTLTQTVALPTAELWSPEHPALYEVATATSGDATTTRFGLREFRCDAKTGRFYLNGRPYYLRGSNITLHRFFEDPECRDLPWNDKWLRKLLVEIPKEMHWNAFRFCIGPAPERWFELADEAGLLIQNEFFVWTGAPSWDAKYARQYDVPEMIRQYGDWIRDLWNHPSVAIWDANNETLEPLFGQKIIPAVRGLDLSNRPWENSYNKPAGPDDPIEYHPYLFQPTASSGQVQFRMSDLETRDPKPQVWHYPRNDRAVLINEYGWLWLNRDGSPTLLTEKLYPLLLGPNSTADERFALDAYLLAGLTEYWRASRQYAGVLHFVYLTASYPGVFTSDHWLDVKRLKLEPHFADYMGEAFKPLGVYVNFFQPKLAAGTERAFPIRLVNDADAPVNGKLTLTLETANGKRLARAERKFELEPLGNVSFDVSLAIPRTAGKCLLKAEAKPAGRGADGPTLCRRWVRVE